ncbi:MAG: copper resistance protein CopC [Actinobacteria bacterium]|nr:copper resistance protein CopC [Actinomycetota bacterium]
MKKLVSALLAFGVAISAAPSASAHASYSDSNPKARSVITKLPKLLWVEFDGNLITIADKQTNFLTVKNSKGKELSDGKAFVGGARISVNIKDRNATGTIKVSWRVVSEDGHPVSSFLTFTVRK